MHRLLLLAKGMEKLKNFNTINISDYEVERMNAKKRTVTNSNYVCSDTLCKRRNTSNGKLPYIYVEKNRGGREVVDNTNNPFSSDYRRRFNAKVTWLPFIYFHGFTLMLFKHLLLIYSNILIVYGIL